ncbi:MAG: hypothetical protein WAT25_09630, partial [Paracoccaceae bacterium]
ILYPASPPIGTIIVGGVPYRRHLGYSNPLEVNIEIVSQRELPDGSCQVRLRAVLSPTFGNAVVALPPQTYTWYRWAIEDNATLITDVPGTDVLTVIVPLVPGESGSDLVAITVVASSFGPAVAVAPLPGVNLGTDPFIEPQDGPPGAWVGLDTFHSYASTLGDTETISRGSCVEQPLQMTKDADPPSLSGTSGNVTYRLAIRNTSDKDPVIVTSVTDDRLGDLSAVCSPPLPATLPPGGNLNCEITTPVTGDPESTVTNTARASGGYADDGTPVETTASATVEIGSEPRVATCNSATGAGSDAPETIDVDLGGFQGTAAFSWEMYSIKDRMTLTSGGRLIHDTNCAAGSGRMTFEVVSGMESLRVAVEPNCEGTTGTEWNFNFQCPAQGDGSGTEQASSGAPAAVNQQPPAIVPTGRAVDENEPNSSLSTAQPATVGDRIDGRISTTGDADFYRISLATQGELTVKFLMAPAGLDMAFRVLDENGTVVRNWQTAPQEGEAFEGIVDIKTPGAYVIEVRDGNNSSQSPDQYQMITTFVPTADTGEPNDALSMATVLAFNAPVKANILPVGDVDYYAVNLPRQGELTVSFPVAPPGANMAFRVRNETGAVVRDWQTSPQDGVAFTAIVDIKAPGLYYVEVRDGSDNARSALPYELVVTVK